MRRLQWMVPGSVALLAVVGWMAGCAPRVDEPQLPPSTTSPGGADQAEGAMAMQPQETTSQPEDTSPASAPAGEEDESSGGSSPLVPSDARTPAKQPGDTAASPPPANAELTSTESTLPPPAAGKLIPLVIDLPAPAFRGTPVPRNEPNVEEPTGKPRPPLLVPEGTVNLAQGRLITCSDPMPAAGEVDYLTDGDKEASDFGYLELRPGTEWVQVDLGQKAVIYAVLLWHNHAEARVYRDVIVQVSDDPDFLVAQTIFNNDYDNSSGMGIGEALGYVETSEGKLIDAQGVEGRYVRFYSRGNHIDDKNQYVEVEVYGKPAA